MSHDEASEIKKAVDASHRRLDELVVEIAILKGRFEAIESAVSMLRTVPESLAEIRAELRAVVQRLPQQAAPISPWAILMTVLGWVVSVIMAMIAWLRV
jgi:hypothetical protein